MKVVDESKVEFSRFSEVPVGAVFTRANTGSHYLKISTDNEKNNSIILGGSSTWLVAPDEIVVIRNATLVIK